MSNVRIAIVMGAVASLFWGCSNGDSSATFNGPPTGGGTVAEAPPVEVPPEVVEGPACHMGTAYQGFGGRVLVAGRTEDQQNEDRQRIKPYSALRGEFERVMGQAPTLLNQMGGTFSQPPARWYEEPSASAVTVYSTYRVGFVGCLDLTADAPEYASEPEAASAADICTSWARKFWSRAPTQGEVDSCVRIATVDTTKETNPRRRWAYTCASMIASAGFLSY